MFTAINENMPNAKADIEQNDDTFFRNQGQRGGHCKRGGRWGGRGGRCGQANAHGQPQGVNPMEAIGSFFKGMMHNHVKHYGHHNNGAHVSEEYKGHKDFNWRNKKATIVSVPDLLIGKPGEMIFANIEIKNNLEFPWKFGASLLSEFNKDVAMFVDEIAMPIDFAVPENSTFKLVIPIKIKESAQAGDKVYEVVLGFAGRRGTPFGEPIKFNLSIQAEMDEFKFYQTAMDLYEKQVGDNSFPFNEIVEILKEARNDKNLASEMIQRKKTVKVAS